MTGNKAISKFLKIKGLRLRNVVFKSREKAVYLLVKPYKNGCLCPECERRGKIKRIMPEARVWRDVPVCGWTIYFEYQPKEIECPTHGRKQEKIPWATLSRGSRTVLSF